MANAYFEQTDAAIGRLSTLFDFAWPTAAALWNLRWQVRGFVDEVPTATQEDLVGRFTAGSGIRGMDLRKACIDTPWDDQKAIFAGFILTNAFAVYEHWTDSILAAVGDPPTRANPLQIDQPARGLQVWMADKQATISALSDLQFYPSLRADKRYSWPLVGNLMKAYRYFKQGRNALIHRGGVANSDDQDAYADFAPVSGRTHLGMKGLLEHEPFVAGQPVRIHLRGVVGFCDILIRLMLSIDAELSRSECAEQIAENRLREAPGRVSMLSADTKKRNAQVRRICVAAGLPKPPSPQTVYDFMLARGIIRA